MHDPIHTFTEWLNDAATCDAIQEPTAMTLATVNTEGAPTCRIVLLKQHDERGFVFFTNYESHKSQALRATPMAALCFYRMPLDRQVRIEGSVAPVSAEESDAYFARRPRGSQIGAWASLQSQRMTDKSELETRLEAAERSFAGVDTLPRPPHWGGWRLSPQRIEFWQQQNFRLHDRWEFMRTGDGWEQHWLYP